MSGIAIRAGTRISFDEAARQTVKRHVPVQRCREVNIRSACGYRP
jgi:hypothetical protein